MLNVVELRFCWGFCGFWVFFLMVNRGEFVVVCVVDVVVKQPLFRV